MQECEELNTFQDAKDEGEGNPGIVHALQGLTQEERVNELWEEGWIWIFTNGSVSDPSDLKLAPGGCAIYLGHKHPYNTAARVFGRRLNR